MICQSAGREKELQTKNILCFEIERIKMFNLFSVEGAFFNIIKSIYDNPTSNIILNDKRLKALPPKIRNRKDTHSQNSYST